MPFSKRAFLYTYSSFYYIKKEQKASDWNLIIYKVYSLIIWGKLNNTDKTSREIIIPYKRILEFLFPTKYISPSLVQTENSRKKRRNETIFRDAFSVGIRLNCYHSKNFKLFKGNSKHIFK